MVDADGWLLLKHPLFEQLILGDGDFCSKSDAAAERAND
jgi:hypothetical protein